MYSQLYRYNGKILQMLLDNIKKTKEDESGYRPAFGTMAYEPQKNTDDRLICLDSIKLYYWEKFIAECHKNGTELIFALSPFMEEVIRSVQNTQQFLIFQKIWNTCN